MEERIPATCKELFLKELLYHNYFITFLKRDGCNTATADIDWDLHKMVNVANPTDTQDAATKSYVDPTKTCG